jgi:hypothetical protein
MPENSTTAKKVIDLKNIDGIPANQDAAETNLQSEGMERLREHIDPQLDELQALAAEHKIDENAISYSRQHRAFLIEGGRGSGKTTFVINFLHSIRQASAGSFSSLCALPMIDPTLIENKDNIIIVLIRAVEAAVEDHQRSDHSSEKLNRDYLESLEALAGGLSLLDGIGPKEAYGADWEDAIWVMSDGLGKARKARLFERKLNIFFNCALSILGKKAFVLAFDDVDTHFGLGRVILEVIRKYLTSPRLIVLISGDIDLYGRLLRGKIYDDFGKVLLEHDDKIMKNVAGQHDLRTAVRELEEQYLLKVLPPYRRIKMLPLGGLEGEISVKPVHESKVKSTSSGYPIDDWINEKILVLSREELKEIAPQHPFISILKREHLRLVISYLKAIDFNTNSSDNIEKASKDQTRARAMVLRAFELRLRLAGVPSDLLDSRDLHTVLREALSWFSRQDEPTALLTFRNPASADQAIVLHCLMLAIADVASSPSAALKALFTFGLPAALFARPELGKAESREQALAYLWRFDAPFLPEIAARLGAIVRDEDKLTGRKACSFGSVGLLGKAGANATSTQILNQIYAVSPSKDYTTVKQLRDAVREVEKHPWLALMKDVKEDTKANSVAWFTLDQLTANSKASDLLGGYENVLRLVVHRRFLSNAGIFRSISALSLFAVIGEMLKDGTLQDFNSYTMKEGIVPSFGVAKADDDQDENEGDEDEDAAEGTEGSAATLPSFRKKLQEWHDFAQTIGGDWHISPSILGTMARRIHDDLTSLDRAIGPNYSTGQILHRQITVILNAVLASTYSGSEKFSRNQSPKSDDRPLMLELTRHSKSDAKLHGFAAILLSCPLVWMFLDSEASAAPNGRGPKKTLKAVAIDALKHFKKTNPNATSFDFEPWLCAEEITVRLPQSKETVDVTINGFYDLLTVVPRYQKLRVHLESKSRPRSPTPTEKRPEGNG